MRSVASLKRPSLSPRRPWLCSIFRKTCTELLPRHGNSPPFNVRYIIPGTLEYLTSRAASPETLPEVGILTTLNRDSPRSTPTGKGCSSKARLILFHFSELLIFYHFKSSSDIYVLSLWPDSPESCWCQWQRKEFRTATIIKTIVLHASVQ